ncbi:hypothetical protein TrLO_g3163 [Triparma laevis f. longispina]|uniref:Telomeric single stranded DNA binding POT1/Cdc13 domain-containing protein n=1 Tax=Triparma laevis f. longispina TaxID=1714387 RepID=A0A9W7CAY7_9STRA|nr:hypothetical protein TrLO_g3163 [Triparma laevis f. longispina]
MEFFKGVFEPPKPKETKKKAAAKTKKGTKGKENKSKSRGKSKAAVAKAASAPTSLSVADAEKLVDKIVADETSMLKKLCTKKETALTKLLNSKKPTVTIASTIPSITSSSHAVELPSYPISKIHNLRPTLTKSQMLKFSDKEYREKVGGVGMSGPLGFLYERVFTVVLREGEEEEEESIKVHFYDSWATQMSQLLRKGDELKLAVPNICVLKKSKFEGDEVDAKELCICVGPENVGVKFDDSVTCTSILYPASGRGTQARSVEAEITAENVGTISKPTDMETTDPFGKRGREIWTDKTSNKKTKTSEYDYTHLEDLTKIAKDKKKPDKDKVVNVFASILSSTPPRQTVRGEWMTSLTLFTPSLKTAASGITLNVFNPDPNKLPVSWEMGDVIRCHRVLCQSWAGGDKEVTQLLSSKASSFVIISRTDNSPTIASTLASIKKEKATDGLDSALWSVRSTAAKSFTFTLQDAKTARDTWSKMASFVEKKGTIMEKDKAFGIDKMNDDFDKKDSVIDPSTVNGDLTCLVTAVIPNPDQADRNTPFGFLRVWDGSGKSQSDPLPAESPFAKDAIAKGDPGVDAMISVHSASKSRKQKAPPSLCGRVVNVAVWEAPHWEYITNGWMGGPKIAAGAWVRLRNIWDSTMNESRMLMLGERAGIVTLPEWCSEIGDVLTRHSKAVKKKQPFNPQCTVYDPEKPAASKAAAAPKAKKGKGRGKKKSAPSAELSCLAECLGEPAGATFTVRATVVDTNPSFSEDLGALMAASGEGGKVEWQFVIHLTDDTAEIPAILAGEDAAAILGDANATTEKGKKGTAAVKAVDKKLKEMCDDTKIWEMKVGSFEIDGVKYFKVSAAEHWVEAV